MSFSRQAKHWRNKQKLFQNKAKCNVMLEASCLSSGIALD